MIWELALDCYPLAEASVQRRIDQRWTMKDSPNRHSVRVVGDGVYAIVDEDLEGDGLLSAGERYFPGFFVFSERGSLTVNGHKPGWKMRLRVAVRRLSPNG